MSKYFCHSGRSSALVNFSFVNSSIKWVIRIPINSSNCAFDNVLFLTNLCKSLTNSSTSTESLVKSGEVSVLTFFNGKVNFKTSSPVL